jgi:hypothetical protein
VLDGHPGGADRGAGHQPRVEVVLEVGTNPPGDLICQGPLDHHDGLELFGGQGRRRPDPPRLTQVARLVGDVLDPDLLPALLDGQAQGGQAQRLAGGQLLALAQAGLVVHGPRLAKSC